MEKPYFYHKFKVEMAIRESFYEEFVSFMKSFCSLRDLGIEWQPVVELSGHVSVSFTLRGDYMTPSTLVSLGMLWQSRVEILLLENL